MKEVSGGKPPTVSAVLGVSLVRRVKTTDGIGGFGGAWVRHLCAPPMGRVKVGCEVDVVRDVTCLWG